MSQHTHPDESPVSNTHSDYQAIAQNVKHASVRFQPGPFPERPRRKAPRGQNETPQQKGTPGQNETPPNRSAPEQNAPPRAKN